MNRQNPDRPHILFLFSDTGGGHRSAAEAIIEALHLEYGEAVSTEMVDIIKEYAPPPLNHLPTLYPSMVRLPHAWGLGYHLSNGDRRANLLVASALPYVRQPARQLLKQHPCDLIVSVHPLGNAPIVRTLGCDRPPFVSVVTDMVTTHALWYHPSVDLCLVASEEARRRALVFGMQPEQVRVVGMPVADRFCLPPLDREMLRKRFGWPTNRRIVLLVGGGEGMGPMENAAQAIASSKLPIALVIVSGRNRYLKERLEAKKWPIPTKIYGFVSEMPEFMRAAEILVTKAGPGTISEALIAGLPMILYSRLPGQEDGNVTFVTSEGAGVWAPNPEKIVSTLTDWIQHPDKFIQAAAACQRLARPQAAREIAHILVKFLSPAFRLQKTL